MKVVSYFDPQRQPQFWHFVGECGLNPKGDKLTESRDEYVFWLQLEVAFQRHTFGEPPSGWVLDILWAQIPHGEGKFPIIAIGFDRESDSEDAAAYAWSMDNDLQIFNASVDWKAIANSPVLAE